MYIVPQHVWSSVSDPATYADASPVGTGPFMLDKFSPQGYTLKPNPHYWQKSKVHVPEIDFPAYNTNANLVPPVSSGQIDFAGNYMANIQSNYLAKSPDNHTWLNSAPYFSANNVVEPVPEHHQGPAERPGGAPGDQLRDQPVPAQRAGRDRLRAAGQHAPAGCCCPTTSPTWTRRWPTTCPATGDKAKVSSILTADGWKMAGGKWTKNGQHITFSISDPIPYSDYYTDSQLISHQLTALGMDVTPNGIGNPTVWAGDVANGTFDATIHWSNQGPNPYFIYDNWMDSSTDRADRQASRR